MEPFIADLINNSKIPKLIRCIFVIADCAFIILIGVLCSVRSQMMFGKLFGAVLALGTAVLAVYLCKKICRSPKQ